MSLTGYKFNVKHELEKLQKEERTNQEENIVNECGLDIYNFVYNCQTKIEKHNKISEEEDILKKKLQNIINTIKIKLERFNKHVSSSYIKRIFVKVLNWVNPYDQGWTPLMRASYNGNLNCVKMLLTINFKKSSDIIASDERHKEKVYLINYDTLQVVASDATKNATNININAKDSEGRTAIFLAYMNRKMEVVNILLEYKADANCSPDIFDSKNESYIKLHETLCNDLIKFADAAARTVANRTDAERAAAKHADAADRTDAERAAATLGKGGKKSRKRKSKRSKKTRRSRR
jgi:hypothetical protein